MRGTACTVLYRGDTESSAYIVPMGQSPMRTERGSLHHSDLEQIAKSAMIKLCIVLCLIENTLTLDLGKKFGSEQADSLTPISRPNFGVNTQNGLSSTFQSPRTRDRYLIGPSLNGKKLKTQQIFSISTKVSNTLRLNGSASVQAIPSDKSTDSFR